MRSTKGKDKRLYGLEAAFVLDKNPRSSKLELKRIFIFPAHVSCVKAVATFPLGGKWLATGSSGEIIEDWDLLRKGKSAASCIPTVPHIHPFY